MSIHAYQMRTIEGTEQSLADYKGKVLLVVNTASACGLTPHYKGLQQLHETYKDRGFTVLGFPCNQFGGQEPGTEEDIKSFCELNYNVTFPMFAKIEVNGENAHPLYKHLIESTPEATKGGDIEWNFAKFLVDKDGNVVKRYSPRTLPEEIEADIAAQLG